ncbi:MULTISPECIES: trypsin-like peptidase domain-containing protein [Burkholderia]|uniref:trypsin-like peptidase domain-containing protein n=1 Tax=Burkholderia TaxID=32008 RepID=UPI00158C6AEA|nr:MULTISPECIES: trypsin-like peptidase domain-containing protein [Burkholderia]MBR8162229.1 trypsin-like peptidase domain-containing protein [Burkholderia vietnamiensis]MCA8144855.1 trypsin-like peptidase domain-containing protein [Burkholderia vietnamiensis]MEC4595671.1 trypsin-like peptidase domain-containing protein [Burkholderia vietnamiensis]HDR9005827.1 trypsin-like peptidase domain-containing protein [Burkholderia vietnamiensis]
MADVPSLPLDGADLADLVGQITGEWPLVADVWEEFRAAHGYYLRAETGVNREEFLREALWAVQGKGQLRALLVRLQAAGLTSSGLEAAAQPFVAHGFQLQSFVNGRWEPRDALVNGRRYLQACDHICRISIDGNHKGTGVLIRPTVVATAAHVVKELIGPDNRPLQQSVGRLEVCFFHADDMLADEELLPAKPVKAVLHQDWLGHFSPPAAGEGTDHYAISSVEGIVPDVGPWDLALIRLAAPPRTGLGGSRLSRGEPPPVSFGMHVLHHPATPLGKPMSLLWSIGTMKQALGAPKPLRWLHDANTDKGSSGAPCFDNNWNIVALHQAGSIDVATPDQSNRAVPIFSWSQQIDVLAASKIVTPYVKYATDENRERVPVFGRREFQQKAWHAMTASTPLLARQRIFIVMGEPRSGKSFTAAILRELASGTACRLVTVDVRNAASATPFEFARQLLGAAGSTQGSSAPSGSDLTTQLRDVRSEIVPNLGKALEALAEERTVWLVLDGLEICDTAAAGVVQIVEALVATLDKFPHLNLVLIDWNRTVQTESAEVLAPEPSVADILDQVLLTVAPAGFELPAFLRQTLEPAVKLNLDKQPAGQAYARAVGAAEAVRPLFAAMLAGAASGMAGGGGA